MKKNIIVCLGLPALLFTVCSKSNSTNNKGPVITLSSPANNQFFNAGQTVTVSASITSQYNIQQTLVHAENKSNGAIVLHQEGSPASVSSSVTGSFIAQAGINYKVEVEAIDVAGNESQVEITVSGK